MHFFNVLNELIAKTTLLVKGKNRNFNTLFILLIVNFLISAIGFLTRIKMANILGTVSFGNLSYCIAISSYIENVVRYGTDKTLVRDIIQNESKTLKIITSTIFLKSILFTCCILILTFYVFKIEMNNNSGAIALIIIGSSLVSFEAKGAYDATNNIRRHSVYYAGFRSIFYIFIWVAIFTNIKMLTLNYIGIAMNISAVIYIFIQHRWIIYKYSHQKIKFKEIYQCIIKTFHENFPICFAALCGLGLIAFNQLILKEYCGAQELGIYAAAWQFFWVGNLFVLQLARVGQPILARKLLVDERNKKELFLFVFKYVAVMLVTVLPVSLPMVFFPELIIGSFFNQDYIQSIAPLRIIGIYLIAMGVDIVMTQYIIILKKNTLYMIIMSFFGMISMMLSWLIIPKYQATGAAISLLSSHTLAISVLAFFVIQDILKNNFSSKLNTTTNDQ